MIMQKLQKRLVLWGIIASLSLIHAMQAADASAPTRRSCGGLGRSSYIDCRPIEGIKHLDQDKAEWQKELKDAYSQCKDQVEKRVLSGYIGRAKYNPDINVNEEKEKLRASLSELKS